MAPLDEDRWVHLLHDHPGRAHALPQDLRPTVCVVYRRHRYTCPRTGARVCLDAEIRAGRTNAELLPAEGQPGLDRIVFEIKDVGLVDLPWVAHLYRAGFRSGSFSKYGECVRRVIEGGAPL